MDSKIWLGVTAIILFLIPLATATHVNYQWEINGSGTVETYLENPNLVHEMVTDVDGVAYIQMTFLDETDELEQLETTVTKGAANWNDNVDMNDIVDALEKAEKYRKGEIGAEDITRDEYKILMALLGITDAQMEDFYSSEIGPVFESHYNQILSNLYEIEALYITLEKLYPDVYCESRKEVMKKYDLKTVKCGLHSKQCYNGLYYAHEGGFDYCIYTDDGRPEGGMDIHLDNVRIYESDADSLTPFEVTLYNQGQGTIKPVLKVNVKKWENTLGHFEYEMEEVPADGSRTYVVAFDNSELEPGDYTLRLTVYLGGKEILEDVDFTILGEGTLAKEGEIVSIDLLNEPKVNSEALIETRIKNHGDVPAAFHTRGEVYWDGEKVGTTQSQMVLIRPGETESLVMGFNVQEIGEYEVIVRSNHNMEDAIVFQAVPVSVTGRFMASPGAGMTGFLAIIILGLYGTRFLYLKNHRKEELEVIIPRNFKQTILKRGNKTSKGTVEFITPGPARKAVRKTTGKKTSKPTRKVAGKKPAKTARKKTGKKK